MCCYCKKKANFIYRILSVCSFCKIDFLAVVSKIHSNIPFYRSVHDTDNVCTVHFVRKCAYEHKVYILYTVQC